MSRYVLEIIPAIDLKAGRCVRLQQGRDDATTEYSTDPVAVAKEWVRQGARRLHVVNLDGAFGRTSANMDVIASIARSVDAVVQCGGGLRTLEAVKHALDLGVGKVVLGTAALEDPALVSEILRQFGADRIIVALDGKGGNVVTRGWLTGTGRSVIEVAGEMKQSGVAEILYTDVERDGMLTGPDIETLKQLADAGPAVIASGGVGSRADLDRLYALGRAEIAGVIIGKALYEGRLKLDELLADPRFSHEPKIPSP